MNQEAREITCRKRNGETFTFTTKHTEESAYEVLSTMDSDFAQSLARSFGRFGGWTDNQLPWALFNAEKGQRTVEAPAEQPRTPQFANLIEWFKATGLKTPRITLDINGCKLKVAMAGSRSKYDGQLMVTDGGSYPNNEWYGRIERDGTSRLTSRCPEWVLRRLQAWNANPASIIEEAKAHGHRTGNCCFCGRYLETRESVTVGYGPICAGKYGLPWGEEVDREMTEITETPQVA